MRRAALEQRLAAAIYYSSLIVAALWALFGPWVADPTRRTLERLFIVSLVALGGLGWALETRRLDRTVQSVRAEVLEQLALSDDLTGLANRRAFFRQLHQEWARHRRHNRPFSVILLDIDRFKQVNDRYGHHMGDRALRSLARYLERSLRGDDVAARLGGDEFALLLPETSAAGAGEVLARLQAALAQDAGLFDDASGDQVRLRVSGGVATVDETATEADQVVRAADADLYRKKSLVQEGGAPR